MSEFKLIQLGETGAVCEGGVCAIPEAKPETTSESKPAMQQAQAAETEKPEPAAKP